jgi:hypothetical protein
VDRPDKYWKYNPTGSSTSGCTGDDYSRDTRRCWTAARRMPRSGCRPGGRKWYARWAVQTLLVAPCGRWTRSGRRQPRGDAERARLAATDPPARPPSCHPLPTSPSFSTCDGLSEVFARAPRPLVTHPIARHHRSERRGSLNQILGQRDGTSSPNACAISCSAAAEGMTDGR